MWGDYWMWGDLILFRCFLIWGRGMDVGSYCVWR